MTCKVARSRPIRGWAIAVAALHLLAGCSNPVAVADIKAFGAAASAVSSTLEKSRDSQRIFAREVGAEYENAKYVKRNPNYQFPPASLATQPLASEIWVARVQFLKALTGYAQALADLEDPEQGARAEKAVANIQAAVVSSKPPADILNFVDPVGGFIQTAVRLGVIQYNDAFARAAIARAHPWIEQGVTLLKDDFARLSAFAIHRHKLWVGRKRGQLDAFIKDPNTPPTDLYNSYKAFVQENNDIAAGLVLLLPDPATGKAGYIDVLDALVAAHGGLREAKTDRESLDKFLTLVDQLIAIIKVAQAA
jgi:hypothetical protein